MKPRTKFLRIWKNLPEKARKDLVHNAYGDNPRSLNVIGFEIKERTDLGYKLLRELGFYDTE